MTAAHTVLITGCSSGIGRALVPAFVAAGHPVVATARRPDSIADLAGEDVLTLRLDVTDSDSIQAAVEEAAAWRGGLWAVVNNAGYGLMGPAVELDLEAVRHQLETNVIGPLAVVQAALPHLVAQGNGRVVTIGSVSGITVTPFSGAYSASKAALHAFDEALRLELAPFGIHVVTVQPGAIASRFGDTAACGVDRFRQPGSQYRAVAEHIEARARMSQSGPTDARTLARLVVRRVSRRRPPAVVRGGRGARLVIALAHLPQQLRSSLLRRRFGLHQPLG